MYFIWQLFEHSVCSIFVPAYEDGTSGVFRKFGIQNSNAVELTRKIKQHLEQGGSLKSRMKMKVSNLLVVLSVPIVHFPLCKFIYQEIFIK